MAFQQQHRAPAARPVVYDDTPSHPRLDTTLHTRTHLDEPEEWILFSPNVNTDHAASTETPQTLPQSYFGGSLDIPDQSLDDETGAGFDDDNEDLDSLDDGLHAFNNPGEHDGNFLSPDNNELSATVLPAHDGLGTFPGDSEPVQASLWQHEQHNPKRQNLQPTRRASLQRQFDALEEAAALRTSDDEKTQRIERWRLEQSKAILEEMERETRRIRRKRQTDSAVASQRSHSRSTEARSSTNSTATAADLASFAAPESESWWQRLTRQVLQNLIGLDSATLSFIFGDEIPSEARNASSLAEMIDHASRTVPEDALVDDDAWADRLLARVARELGTLMNQISEHPGSFSEFLKTQEPLPYAGLVEKERKPAARSPRNRKEKGHRKSPSAPQFTPTLANRARHVRRSSLAGADTSLWGIEEEDDLQLTPMPTRTVAALREEEQHAREKEYWEKDLDIKMVFGFLKNRISSSYSPQEPEEPFLDRPGHPSGSSPPGSTSESMRRAALIRRQHPLVESSSASAQRQRLRSSSTPLSPILGRRSIFFDGTESCASQSTKRSKTRHSGSISLSSSHNYWDIGASSVGSAGHLRGGTWGEV